jgi:protein-disulfide isomerase
MSKEGMSKRQARRDQRRRAEQRSRMIVIIGVVLVAVAAAAFLIIPNVTPVGGIKTVESVARPQAKDNAAGDPNAPVKLEEFSDFQCPYCARFAHDTEAQIMDAYVKTGKLYFVYRSFGAWIGTESGAAAEAAYCAGEQNKFWEMHDIIFANQTGENIGDFTNRRLTAFADKIGLDMGSFSSCFNAQTYKSRIDKDKADGLAGNIKATPSFLMTYTVNGQTKTEVIEGAVPFSEFQSKIDAALAEMGK